MTLPSPTTIESPADILTAAADLLEKPGAWTQGCFARNARGEETGLSEFRGAAVCWCTMGAIHKVAPDDHFGLSDAAFKRFVGMEIDEYNDDPNRTQAEVVAALRAAADLARTEQVKG